MDVITDVDKECFDFLVQELTSNNGHVREEAAHALIRMEYQIAVDPLYFGIKGQKWRYFPKKGSRNTL